MEFIEVTDDTGAIVAPDWLSRAEGVHRQLREQLPADYAGALTRIFAGGGRMVVAVQDGRVAGVAVWRVYENTFSGLQLHVDDLVTDEARRSSGVGRGLLRWLEQRARVRGCRLIQLDSGTHRQRAHAFYFREGMPIVSFHFAKRVKPG